MRRLLTIVLVLIAVVAGLLVAGVALPRRTHFTRTYSTSLHRVVIRVGSGQVDVTANRQRGAQVVGVRRYTLREPTLTTRVRSGVLYATATCPKPTIVTCKVDLRIGVAPDVAVDVVTGSGDVRVENVAAPVKVRSSAGAVDVVGLTGTGDIGTSAGPITGRDLAVTQLRATSAAGAVSIAFAVAPDRVTASTGAGDVDVSLPDDSYRVTTRAPAGRARVLVPNDAESSRTVDLRTGAGRITVRRAPPM